MSFSLLYWPYDLVYYLLYLLKLSILIVVVLNFRSDHSSIPDESFPDTYSASSNYLWGLLYYVVFFF